MSTFIDIYFTDKPNKKIKQEFNSTNELFIVKNDDYYDIINNKNCYKFRYEITNNKISEHIVDCLSYIDFCLISNSGEKLISYNIYETHSDVDEDKRCYHVFRISSIGTEFDGRDIMIDDDYKLLSSYNFGGLYIDAGLNGKDLFECYNTNDIQTVKEGRVVHQDSYNTWLSTIFFDSSENTKNNYETWCELNEVHKYGYDISEPKYNYGRLKIGQLVNEDIKNIDDVLNVKLKFPYLLDIKIENE
jgi:hypothetical protein